MSRPLTQLLPPDLPAGASPQFGSSNPASGSLGGGHLGSMASLKSLLQLPIKGDQRGKDCCDMKDKDKPLDSDEDSLVGGVGGSSSSSSGGGCSLRSTSQSAFLGPLLWERTLPCDGGLFQLQYMDLEEFLTENGMGSLHNNSSSSAQIPSQSSQSAVPNQSQSSQCPPSSPPPCSSASSSSASSPSLLGLDMQQPTQSMLGGQGASLDPSPSASSSCPPPPAPPTANGADVMVNFDPDPADLALSSDDKYWSRRCKNNEAAKRSRDARRLKENQISVRAAFLERENAALRQEVADMRKELGRCRNMLSKYESRHEEQ
ncbi:hypothetical protein JZ751_008262 [Albula glossodonta]|uniref:BZIP domain-containing protein n=1 Tax=Albula glossodonta TaxID=121402 RepID=A0A8T2N4E6_9TELE|nr:hypothetical protein JZ751_008262 [Albula glossodonta]